MEGMERFSYYGFRAILTLYFVSLNMRESSAAAGFMFTSALAYAAPLVGARPTATRRRAARRRRAPT